MSVQALSDVLGNRIICSDIWPASSPDLNPCDFFYWGCLKDKIYSSNPRTKELKGNIRREISNIPAEGVQKVKKRLLPPVRGMSTCRGTGFPTPPMICEQK
jgi:hypothetical protein